MSVKKSLVPLRSFIFHRLYHPKGGYFCRQGSDLVMQIFKLDNCLHPSISNLLSASMIISLNFFSDTQKMRG